MKFIRQCVRFCLAAVGVFLGLSFVVGLALALFGSLSGEQAFRDIGSKLVLLPIGAFLLLVFSPLGEVIAFWPFGSRNDAEKSEETAKFDEKRLD